MISAIQTLAHNSQPERFRRADALLSWLWFYSSSCRRIWWEANSCSDSEHYIVLSKFISLRLSFSIFQMHWACSWTIFGILFSPIQCLSYSFSWEYASELLISQPLASICAWRIWERRFFSWKLKLWLLWEYMCTGSTMLLNSALIDDISELSMSEPESRLGCSWNWSIWRIRCLA